MPRIRSKRKTTRHMAYGAIVFLMLLSQLGCLRRRLTVRTNPSGAMVYVDRQPLGKTPVSHSFSYYGTRHFEIVKDGYRTEEFLRTFRPPWYEIPPLDFFTETLWPFEKRDERIVDVQMVPDKPVPTEALVTSAEGLRLQASQGIAVMGPTLPPGSVPSTGYPAPPLNQSYVDPTLPGQPGATAPVLPSLNPSLDRGPVLPTPQNGNPNGFYLPDLLTPPTSIPSLNITPGNSYRPSTPESP